VLRVGDRFKWTVRDDGGKVVESASETYATETAALRAGNAAARAIRERIKTSARAGANGSRR